MSRTKLLLILCLTIAAIVAVYLTGCDKLVTETIEIPIAGNPTAEFAADVEIGCEPLTVHFTDESSGPYQVLIWDFGDGGIDSVEDPVHIYDEPGMYSVRLTIRDTLYSGDNPAYQGIDVELKKRFIVVGASAGKIVASDTVACVGSYITFQPEDTSIVDSVRWNFGDGTAPTTLTTPSHLYDSVGVYSVSLTAYGSCGVHTTTEDSLIRITNCPTVHFVGTPTEGCVPLQVVFRDSTQIDYVDDLGDTVGISTRVWNFGNGQNGSSNQHTITYTQPGTYTVKLTIEDSKHAVSTDSIVDYITVWDTSTANFIAETPPQLCKNPFQQFQVTFAPTYPGTFDSLKWAFGDGDSLLDTNVANGPRHPTHAYFNPGKYEVSLSVFGPCGNVTTKMPDFVILSAPIQTDSLAFEIVPDSGDTSDNFTFVDKTNGVVTAWEWNFGDGTAVSTDSLANHKFSAYGDYWVKFTAINACGQWIDSMLVRLPDTTGTTK